MRDNYNRLYELYDFINELRRHVYTGMTYDEIMERFGWTRKTTERMLNVVETLMGDAFKRDTMDDGSRRKCYRISNPDPSKLPPDFISPDEIIALHNAARMVKNNADISRSLETLSGKLENINKSNRVNIDDLVLSSGTVAIPYPKISTNKDILIPLQNAILGFKMVEIVYGNHRQKVCPLGFLYGRANNFLVAAPPEFIKTPVKYVLGDIKSVRVLDKSFDADGFDIKKYAAKSFGVYIENNDGFDVEWCVSKSAAADAKQYNFHPTQKITENSGGTLTIKFHACGLREMAWHLFTWGGEIVPVAPSELVEEYKTLLSNATKSVA